ncbi:MAG TPA: hypothetical protein VF131_02065 [Blastocatellia bacterium]|nr:hypothetical protein [Blastocatellia bacterium]
MDQERGNEFHKGDSEPDELYDLYNICNGRLYEGRLDLRRLDELSRQEEKIFDVAKLRRLGAHLAGGCARCEAIIKTLNAARQALSRSAADSYHEHSKFRNANHTDSGWKQKH